MSGVSRSALILHDGASLAYLTTGVSSDDPVLLIHGSTETAESDWFVHSPIGSRLAQLGYFVIAPDCRRHGRSTASRDDVGRLMYSFERMAADGAELLRALGMPRAFVCGHSTGGTVALCLTKSFPLQVRAAVVLAGNAYVDECVRTRVSIGMNPERVNLEKAAWRDAMISLHDTFNGEGYWRELLTATISETITYPQWTAADLADLDVPVLAVQGTDDSVNVPGDATPRPSPSGYPAERCGSPRAVATPSIGKHPTTSSSASPSSSPPPPANAPPLSARGVRPAAHQAPPAAHRP